MAPSPPSLVFELAANATIADATIELLLGAVPPFPTPAVPLDSVIAYSQRLDILRKPGTLIPLCVVSTVVLTLA